MAYTIHIHPKVEKLLNEMEVLDNAPSIAAKRARRIIQRLLEGAQPSHSGRMSQKRDTRIEHLIKFDLGSGYRLIMVREKYSFHILHIGSHDNCDAWLTANRSKKPHKTDVSMTVYSVKTPAYPSNPAEDRDSFDLKDDSRIQEISQKVLRKIFSGILSNRP